MHHEIPQDPYNKTLHIVSLSRKVVVVYFPQYLKCLQDTQIKNPKPSIHCRAATMENPSHNGWKGDTIMVYQPL